MDMCRAGGFSGTQASEEALCTMELWLSVCHCLRALFSGSHFHWLTICHCRVPLTVSHGLFFPGLDNCPSCRIKMSQGLPSHQPREFLSTFSWTVFRHPVVFSRQSSQDSGDKGERKHSRVLLITEVPLEVCRCRYFHAFR